ncbi:KLTH0F07810p [Lachancea thermotolerans CBS 6340]|uniref:KLTH0F07810p n=1 Tax=Lachancea thermotolerans (strain ATCC 56472 / CBS 6340 / NRRL Y-8284) TaxID=559295 RepID=C5DKV4_LACTC|nr:KLTH0F07810p [Lachancea thermotolerans CBS 6340]CAR24105.1 KLTH0F07810p [Lachancea thermotolerans CBS 6340]
MSDKITEKLKAFSSKMTDGALGHSNEHAQHAGGDAYNTDSDADVDPLQKSESDRVSQQVTEDQKAHAPGTHIERNADEKPRTKSFLESDGIDEMKPVTRKHRVSSLSLSDQWRANQDLHPLTSMDNNEGTPSSRVPSRKASMVSRHSSVSRRASTVRTRQQIIDHERVASYAFAFDIDGVIVRGPETIPEARDALRMLNGENKYNIKVPYIFITNGGGRSEKARCKDLSKRLNITVTKDQVIQGHTPMKDLVPIYKNVLVVGGVLDSCRKVAQDYGFKNVYIPLDIMKWNPSVTPYYQLSEEENAVARDVDFSKVPIDAILVFADSRNWAADQQIILEILLSKNGVMGTVAKDPSDNKVGLYFAHSDFVWATDYGLSRYGMGALQVSIAALYQEHTGRELQVTRFGKPQRGTFRFAEKVLSNWRRNTLTEHVEQLNLEDGETSDSAPSDSEDEGTDTDGAVLEQTDKLVLDLPPASTVYFVGDTPESDIRFANSHDSSWYSILVKTGVFQGNTTPKYQPKKICENVLEAVKFAIEREHQKELEEWNSSVVDAPVVDERTAKIGNR